MKLTANYLSKANIISKIAFECGGTDEVYKSHINPVIIVFIIMNILFANMFH